MKRVWVQIFLSSEEMNLKYLMSLANRGRFKRDLNRQPGKKKKCVCNHLIFRHTWKELKQSNHFSHGGWREVACFFNLLINWADVTFFLEHWGFISTSALTTFTRFGTSMVEVTDTTLACGPVLGSLQIWILPGAPPSGVTGCGARWLCSELSPCQQMSSWHAPQLPLQPETAPILVGWPPYGSAGWRSWPLCSPQPRRRMKTCYLSEWSGGEFGVIRHNGVLPGRHQPTV